MTTHHFGTDINGGLVFENPDSAAPGTTVPLRVASGTVRVADGSVADGSQATALLTPISAQHSGYWDYTTTDVPSIWIEGENGAGTATQWMGPFYSREYQATARYSKTEADARFAAIGSTGGLTTVASTDITDSTTTGRAILTAANAAAARTASGALADSAVSTYMKTVLDDADATTARSTLQALGTGDFPLAVATLNDGDILSYDAAAGTWSNGQPDVQALPNYLLQGAILNPGQAVPGDWPNGAIAFIRGTAPVLGITQIGKNGVSSGTSTTLTVTLTDAVAIGDYVYVSVTAPSPGTVLSTITVADSSTGGTANTYVARGSRLQGPTIQAQDFSVKATSALAIGATVTATFAVAVGDIEMAVSKMTGLVTASSAWDQAGQASNTGVTQVAVSTGGATAQANELAVLTVHWNSGTLVDPASWTQTGWTQVGTTQTSSSGTAIKNVAVVYKLLTTTQTVTVTPQVTASGVVVALLNTYRAA